jgi:hypothetical protein
MFRMASRALEKAASGDKLVAACDMFNWSVRVGWDNFCFQGVKNMEGDDRLILMSRLP